MRAATSAAKLYTLVFSLSEHKLKEEYVLATFITAYDFVSRHTIH